MKDLRGASGETTADVAARIDRARDQQAARFRPESPSPINAAMNTQELRRFCTTTTEGRALLEAAFER